MYITSPDSFLLSLIQKSFPSYTGKKIQIKPAETINSNSMWDGGSRSDFVAVKLDTLERLPESKYMNLKEYSARQETPVPVGIAIIEHQIFRGKDFGLVIHVNPENMTKLLESSAENAPTLTNIEKMVIRYTACLKSSYGGISNYRFYQANRKHGVTLEEWELAKKSLYEKKLLNKAGAITLEGRNFYDSGKAN